MKNTKKRAISLAIALALMITSGCGQSGTDSPATVSPVQGQTADTPSAEPEAMTESVTTAPADAMPGVTIIPEEYMEELLTFEPVADPEKKTGVLSMLRMDEESYTKFRLGHSRMYLFLIARGLATVPEGTVKQMKNSGMATPVYYDSLDSMIMGLQSGELYSMDLAQSVAKYVVSRNDQLQMGITIDMDKANDFDKYIIEGVSQGYSFMMTEDRTALRDDFNKAIADMKSDGTLDKLKKTYIDDVISGKDPEPVAFEKNDGETIKVAITGSLPPMDFIAPDGTPAGFNTAILAEIGKRLGINIELLQVDSLGRAAALASGFVDVVFWTRGRTRSDIGETQAEVEAYIENTVRSNLTDEQLRVFDTITAKIKSVPFDEDFKKDMPDGTICTQPYFSDICAIVTLKK